jgi:ABC-type phosphate transport system auxiliary subunit
MDAIETEKIVTTAEMFEIVGNELKEKNAEIERLRLANSDLQMHYDYARTECDKLKAEVQRLRGSLAFISMLTPLSGQSWESHAKFINAYAINQLEEEE